MSKYEHCPSSGDTLIEFHRGAVMQTLPGPAVTVPKDPIQQQLAERRPDYARLFPQGFPTHAPKDIPKDTPKTE